jgi:hypothetical protein
MTQLHTCRGSSIASIYVPGKVLPAIHGPGKYRFACIGYPGFPPKNGIKLPCCGLLEAATCGHSPGDSCPCASYSRTLEDVFHIILTSNIGQGSLWRVAAVGSSLRIGSPLHADACVIFFWPSSSYVCATVRSLFRRPVMIRMHREETSTSIC